MTPRSVVDCLGNELPVRRTWEDGSYECPHCGYAVPVGTPAHDAGRCPNPACLALGGEGTPQWSPDRARQVLADRELRERAEAERVELARVRHDASSHDRADEHRQVEQARAEAGARGACARCAVALVEQYRAPKFVKHRGPCPRERR